MNRRIVAVVCVTLAFAAISVTLLLSWYGQTEATFIKNEKEAISKHVREAFFASAQPDDFLRTDKDAQKKALDVFWVRVQSPDIIRMKVWKDDMVVWSDVSEIVGQRFSDNDEIELVLRSGESVVEVKSIKKTENITEQQYGELMEVYVPIFDEQRRIVGIVEVYASTIDMRSLLQKQLIQRVLLFGIPLLSLYAFGMMVLWQFLVKRK